MDEETKEKIDYEINEVRLNLLRLKNGEITLKEFINECYEKNDRLGTAIDLLGFR